MTLETVLNWLTEHAVRYNHNNLLSLLSEYFPNIVPHEVTFPNKEWLIVLGLLDKMLRYRRKKQRKNVAVDQSLKSCEFWRRLQKLLVNIYRETKDRDFIKRNIKRFNEFISQIKLIEVMIFSKDILAPQLDVKIGDNIVMDTQSQGLEKDQSVFGEDGVRSIKNGIEDKIQEIIPFKQKEFSNKVDTSIISVLQDDFIIDLRQFVSNDILKSQQTGLEQFLGCRDDFETSNDPYMQILCKHTKDFEISLEDEEGESSIPESSLISLVKLIDDEVMMQDIPSPPIVVYLRDRETQGIVGIKVKQDDMFVDS